ncbi:MAG: transketolase [Planctomycetota bacterium]|nr:transketolase [Planctomycetota bacterium]
MSVIESRPTAVGIEQLAINTIRTLSMDAVQAANSGHPGTPMALAPVAYSIWQNELRYDPTVPDWAARDRFVLSCGHASMLLYSLLNLAEVVQIDANGKPTGELACPIEQVKLFRQLHSRCPGHPEYFETTGVETTTGPLGQGCGNSVGMAIAQRWLAAHFSKPGFDLFDYRIYTLCSDGDLMEGVACEAASIAGHLGLSNLCWIYDNNHITIERETDLAYSEEVGTKFEGLGWNVLRVDDANDLVSIQKALHNFQQQHDRPTMIILRSIIGYGSPHKAGSHEAHGSPLGVEEIKETKAFYGWPQDKSFYVPDEVKKHFREGIIARGKQLRTEWEKKFADYSKKFPELAEEWKLMQRRELPAGWDSEIPVFPADAKGVASRISGGKVLNAIAKRVPWLIGGSADLAPSTMTTLTFEGNGGSFEADNYGGRNFHFGIREHGMVAALNGMAVSHVRPFGATFFCFYDYCRPSIRLAALSGYNSIVVFTHDSIGLGEDGPTHQPVEHLASARAVPNLITLRPGDANEVAEAWRAIMPIKNRPVILVLTRQNLPTLDRTKYAPASGTAKGAYVLADAKDGQPKVILMATGSELSLAVEAYEKLTAEGIAARVVSMPSWELFEDQDEAYRNSVLPPDVTARVAIEAAVKFGWERYLGTRGLFVGMKSFGASAPASVLYKHFGITADAAVAAAKKLL